MLPLVGLLVFAMLGVTSLAVDLGFATAQQQRLEVAAEATARAAIREEARVRHELDLGIETMASLGCHAHPDPEACIDQRVQDAVSVAAVEPLLLGPDPEPTGAHVDLFASPKVTSVESCGPRCWKAQTIQAAPLLFGQASMVGFEPGAVRQMLDDRQLGSALSPTAPVAGDSLRTHGVPLRGLAATEAQPANRVGEAIDGSGLPGRAPFSFDLTNWSRTLATGPFFALLQDDGSLFVPGWGTVGRRLGQDEGFKAGDLLVTAAANPVPITQGSNPYLTYVPITSRGLVVGFAYARVSANGSSNVLRIEALAERLAPGNASASPRNWVGGSDDAIEAALIAQASNRALLLQTPVLR